jgi:hypothetical protein
VAATRFTISQTISIETHIASPKSLTIVYWDIHQSHKILRRGPMNHQDGEWWEYWDFAGSCQGLPEEFAVKL